MEIHLANRLDVSRTPIREAIRKLENEGLVRIIPRSGAQVAQISEQELQDVLEIRRSLDSLSASLACRRMTEEEKKALRSACDDFEKMARGGRIVEVAEADVAFHDVIINATKNKRLIEIVRNLADQMYRYRFEYIKDDGNYEQLIAEHRALADAICAGDAEQAAEIAIRHIDRQETSVLAQLKRK